RVENGQSPELTGWRGFDLIDGRMKLNGRGHSMRNILLISAACAVLAACQGTTPASLAQAESHFAQGDLRTARVELMNLLAAQPANVGALALMTKIQIASGDGVGAEHSLDLLEKAGRKVDPGERAESLLLQDRCDKVDDLTAAHADNAVVVRVDALCTIRTGVPADGRVKLDAAVTRFPDDAPLLATRARLALIDGDMGKGMALAAAAAKADADDFDALMVNGELQARLGNMTASITWFDRAAKRNPLSMAPLVAKGEVQAVLKDRAAYAKTVDSLAALAPQSAALGAMKARLALMNGDARAAQAELLATRKVMADSPALQMLAGEIALALGNRDTAISELSRLIAVDPGNAPARLMLARALFENGDAVRAAAALRPVAARADAPRDYVAAMAKYAKAAGDADAARFALRATFPSPERIAGKLGEADTAMQRQDWRGAVRIYDDLMAETGDKPNVLVLNNLGWAHFKLGNHDRALALLARAAKAAPTDASVLDSYGWVLFKSGGDKAKARALLEKAAAAAPGNATIRQHLTEARGG
ncbi:MAG: hypothetical protein RLZZ58_1247, partial [Pseudomonadota bacterium]